MGRGVRAAASPSDHRRVSPVGGESRPGSASTLAQRLPSSEDRPLPAITMADQNWWGGGSREAAGQGGGASWPDVPA